MADEEHSTKLCAGCKQTKAAGEFGKNHRMASGLKSYCKPCELAANRRHKKRNAAKHREYQKKYTAANRERDRAKNRERQRLWRLRHLDRERARVKDAQRRAAERKNAERIAAKDAVPPAPPITHQSCRKCGEVKPLSDFYPRSDNPARRLSSCRPCQRAYAAPSIAAWRKANAEKVRLISRANAGMRRAAVAAHVSIAELQAIRAAQRGRCALCRIKLFGKGQLDHIMAIANGGKHERRNLQWLCAPCNRAKSAKDQIEFMQSRGQLL